MASLSKYSSLISSIQHTPKASSRLLANSSRPVSNSFNSRFNQQRATMATRTEAGEAISQVAQAEGGTTKGSLSAQMQSELDRSINAQNGTQGNSSNNRTEAGQAISEVARAEGGPTKGSASAQMQSQLDKQQNAQQGIGGNAGSLSGGKSAAGQAISEVAHAEGGTTKGSLSAQMQSELTRQQNAQGGIQQNSINQQTGSSAKSPAGQAISEVAKAEGGPFKGSESAKMQSEVARQQNSQSGNVSGLGQNNSTAKSPAGQAISEVSRVEGGTTKGSESARMQSEITKQMNAQRGVGSAGNSNNLGNLSSQTLNNSTNGTGASEAHFQQAAEAIAPKIQDGTVTKEEANILHAEENRAHGRTEKGGIASQAQHVVSEKEKGGL